jgi:hypothetical protein
MKGNLIAQLYKQYYIFYIAPQPPPPPGGPGFPYYRDFTNTLRHTTVSRTPLDGRSAQRRDLHLTTHNNHMRQTSMDPAGFETKTPAIKWPQTHALDRVVPGTGL